MLVQHRVQYLHRLMQVAPLHLQGLVVDEELEAPVPTGKQSERGHALPEGAVRSGKCEGKVRHGRASSLANPIVHEDRAPRRTHLHPDRLPDTPAPGIPL